MQAPDFEDLESASSPALPAAAQHDLTAVVVPLLKGVVYREDDAAL